MITRPKKGDIFVTIEDEMNIDDVSSDDVFRNLGSNAFHGMIFGEKETKSKDEKEVASSGTVYHSSSGFYHGVISHPLIKLQFEGFQNMFPIGMDLVIRTKDDRVNQSLFLTAKLWGDISPEVLSKIPLTPIIPKTEDSDDTDEKDIDERNYKYIKKMPTPFTMFSDRRADDPTLSPQLELYRAFRAYNRNRSTPVAPLSKKKGISCGNFVNYALKVAIIDRLFPHGLPEKIQKKIQEIENIKLQSQKPKENTSDENKEKPPSTDQRISKLSQLNTQLFKEFETIVKESLTGKDEHKDSSFLNKEEWINFLTSPVKHTEISEFCIKARAYKNLFDFVGYLFFIGNELDKDTLSELKKLKPGNETSKFEKLFQLEEGELNEESYRILFGLLGKDVVAKESYPTLLQILEKLVTPVLIDHDSYQKLLAFSGGDQVESIVSIKKIESFQAEMLKEKDASP